MRFVIRTCAFLSLVASTKALIMPPKLRLALIDRDGVINVDVGPPGVIDANDLELTEGAGLALGKLRRGGYTTALITNQSCVGKGLITEDDLSKIHQRMQELLLSQDPDAKFDKLFYCTSTRDQNDYRSKPNPGMIEEAMELFGDGNAKTFGSVLFIGDTLTDLQAAASAHVPTRILVETGYGHGIMMGQAASSAEGSVTVVDKHDETKIDLTTISDCTSQPSIFPFLYAKNFFLSVEWILRTMATE